jgi:hypothetical protein
MAKRNAAAARKPAADPTPGAPAPASNDQDELEQQDAGVGPGDEEQETLVDEVDDTPIKVRAFRVGYYEHVRRRVGHVFYLIPRDVTVYNIRGGRPELDENKQVVMKHLTPQDQFSPLWMELVDDDEPETEAEGAQAALTKATNELKKIQRAAKRK